MDGTQEHTRADLRTQRRRLVYQLVNENGGLTAADVAARAELPRATAGELLRELEGEGLVVRRTPENGTHDHRGRPPALFLPAEMGRFSVCLDVGHFRLRGAVFDPSGKTVTEPDRNTHLLEKLRFTEVRDRIYKSLERLVTTAALKPDDIRGLAVALPAAIHHSGTLGSRSSFESWPRVPELALEEFLKKDFGKLRVFAGNDVNLCLLGEQRLGGTGVATEVLFIKATSEFGCALLANGRLYDGASGIAGQISHFPIGDRESLPAVSSCEVCGLRNCLQNIASTRAIIRDVAHRTPQAGDLGIKKIIDLALKEDDKDAKEAIERAGRYLGIAIRHLVQLLDPELVLIGGVLSTAGDLLLDEVRSQVVVEDAKAFPRRDVRVALVGDHEKSALYGGFALIQERLALTPAPG